MYHNLELYHVSDVEVTAFHSGPLGHGHASGAQVVVAPRAVQEGGWRVAGGVEPACFVALVAHRRTALL